MKIKDMAALLGVLASLSACSGSSGTSQVQGAQGGSANAAGDGSGAGKGVGGSLDLGVDTGSGLGASGASDAQAGASEPGATCAQSSSVATLEPLTMLVMMDDSGSMNDDDKWNQAAGALKTFFADPATAGLRVGLRLFPSDQPTVGCTDTECDVDPEAAIAACSTPVVDIAALTAAAAPADAQEAKLLAAIPPNPQMKGDGSGGTPTSAALQGAENIAVKYAAAHPSEKVVVVFVTDGEPVGCDENIGHIAKIASDTLAQHAIETYVIGILGSNQNTLDRIAKAGGTEASIMIGGSDGATTEQDLLKAFGAIQTSNVSCDFAVPAPPKNLQLSFDNVNVTYTPGSGMKRTLSRVRDAASCGAAGGWYYDINSAPTQIHLCAGTCTTVQAEPSAALSVLYSCIQSQGYVPPK
jgi:Mg-chelatase subunit ChlD